MKSILMYLLLFSVLLLNISCYTTISGKKEIFNTNRIELQIIDAETEKPIPDINVHYYFRARRPISGFIYANEHRVFPIKRGNLLTDNYGNVYIEGIEYSGRSFDQITLHIHININFDYEGIEIYYKNIFGSRFNENFDYFEYGFSYFVLYDHKEYITILNKNYYPAYVLIFNREGNYSYVINQINNSGNRELDFKSEDIDNIIYYEDSEKIKISLKRVE